MTRQRDEGKRKRKRQHTCVKNKFEKLQLTEKNKEDDNRNSDEKVTVTRLTLSCTKREEFYDKFLNYESIENYLRKMKQNYPDTIDIIELGKSKQGKSIYLIAITEDLEFTSSNEPKFATFIEAGLNGEDIFAVSNALFIIDYLCKNPNIVKVMDYFIVPCSNPDAYEMFIKDNIEKTSSETAKLTCPNVKNSKRSNDASSKIRNTKTNKAENKNSIQTDLTLNFPVILGVNNMKQIPSDLFIEKIKVWKENFDCSCPETIALIKGIFSYQFAIKLFISLREGGEFISYPFGFTSNITLMHDCIKQVAQKGKFAIKQRNFQCGTINELQGLVYGHLIDFLKLEKASMKFLYNIHVHKPISNYEDELKNIISYGCQIMECIQRMSITVFKTYTDMVGNKKVETEYIKFRRD
ncbi:hypothetical protein ABEB36_008658 [Hypothenemus hampei]|uniref:Peptidase M14 domain-containing protein n=1 Tax=Hypothenemus hampei TaxID=57062 RepID=A0ABD1EMN0_HYPHA